MSGRAARTLAVLLTILGAVLAGCGSSGDRQLPPGLGSLASSGAGHRFYEIYDPVGSVRGTMLLIHGGAWQDQRGDARRTMASAALTLRANGWRVVDIAYSPGPSPGGSGVDPWPMFRDVVAFYDQVRHAYAGPICAYGESAGGHLAAMLATERPSLTCAVLNAAPLDLRTLLRQSSPAGAAAIRQTFGTRRSVLDAWSPARRWGPDNDATLVFATAASNDEVVPPQQLRGFTAAVPSADALVVPGADAGTANAVTWMHSTVRRSAIDKRVASFGRWLDDVAPRRAGARIQRATNTGAGCDLPGADPATQPLGERWKLMLAGDAWRQASTAGQPIAATRGCSGSAGWQDDGLSLWAFPAPGVVLPAGTQASLVLQSRRVVRRLSATFRGFLARPQDWAVGLYASTRYSVGLRTKVAACERGRCTGLRLVKTTAGALIAAGGSGGDPDRREEPISADFALPPGTRRIAWRLRCVAAKGCSLAGSVNARGVALRPRDPLGHPAIFSLYNVEVR
ncbi:MAG: hypothetical protein JWO02_4236 [Solirubrobacterales bacterium]|nr:hypothetical protein [Solirubrobacterales bacterium]